MSQSLSTPSEMYGKLVDALLIQPEVTQSKKKGFGSGLRIHNKVFAMLVNDKLVVKLPNPRINELVTTGEGKLYEYGDGRVTKEWVEIEYISHERWMSLATEAMNFVASIK
jgi:hypothetical protein